MRGFIQNVTFIQVEALKECFDFLHNGYVDTKGWFGDEKWLLYFKHAYNHNDIKVTVRPYSYIVEKNGKLVKSVEGLEDLRRYDCYLDSQVTIKAKRVDPSGNKIVISGSVLPNIDAE